LQSLSTQATQNLTVHCKQTVANFDKAGNSYEKAVTLVAWNEITINHSGPKGLKYEVLEDGCQDRSGTWYKTVISYATHKPRRLPITDVVLRDFNQDKMFRIEVGPACFY